MKQLLAVVAVVAILGVVAVWNPNQAYPPEAPQKLLRHVVLFKFKADARPEQIRAVEQGFAALPGQIAAIHALEWGTNNSSEGHDQGYTHCFLVTFQSEEDRAAYLPHPAHLRFVEVLKPILEQVHVVDYWTGQ